MSSPRVAVGAPRLALAFFLLLPVACEKEGANSGKSSGALDDSERSVLSHLIHMVDTHRVDCDGEPGPDTVYRHI